MSEDSPKIVNLEASLELSEFFSEMDWPSESNSPLEVEAPTVALAQLAAAAVQELGVPRRVCGRLVIRGRRAREAAASQPARLRSRCSHAPTSRSFRRAQNLTSKRNRCARARTRGRRPSLSSRFDRSTPAAVALPSLPSGPVTLVELIERRGGFDWREAVAVIHQICLYLRDHSPQAPILLDPRTIQITDKGEVHLLSGQTSSDPLVIQVGRLLRTMLMGKEAPPELRLLLAQATFELPIFESIEDVDRALAQLNKLDEPGPAGLALLRAVAAPTPPPNPDYQLGNPPPPRPIIADEARDDATGSFERAIRGASGWLRLACSGDFCGHRVDRRATRHTPRDAVPCRGPGGTNRPPDTDGSRDQWACTSGS